jgi:HK97 family phage prohead protease
MPWHIGKSSECPSSKPWAVIRDSDDAKVACHPTQASAKKHLAALYANEPGAGRSQQTKEGDLIVAAVERRFTTLPVELRATGDTRKIGGYAAKFGKESRNLGGFIEVVTPSFFNKSRGDGWPEVMARYNHDDNQLLGTTAAGTLNLRIDGVGLDYEVTPPRSAGYVVELVERGDVRKSSFAFRLPEGGDEWGLSEQGYPKRSLISGQLVDVAPVNTPAYADSTTALRALQNPDSEHVLQLRNQGVGPEAALRSLALKMSADFDEVRELALADELRKFFVRTDGPAYVKPKPRVFGPSAAAQLLARKSDPWG